MEKPSFLPNPSSWLTPATMVHLFWLDVIANYVGKLVHRFILESNSFLRSLFASFLSAGKTQINQDHDDGDDDGDDDELVGEHGLAMVMDKMGLRFDQEEGETLRKIVRLREVSGIFEEKEPSIEELKAAFDVFDENKDGFIDALELKRVLETVGIGKGCGLDACERMIRGFDVNGDGRIDYEEFFGLMRKALC